jgi:hypothetical protein
LKETAAIPATNEATSPPDVAIADFLFMRASLVLVAKVGGGALGAAHWRVRRRPNAGKRAV